LTTEIDQIVERFKAEQSTFKRVAGTVERRVRKIADENKIRCQISSRVKDSRSFQKKLLINHYAQPWDGVTDKIGVRAVVQVPSDVDLLCKAIAENYGSDNVRWIDDKRQGPPDQLAYSGVHMQVAATSQRAASQLDCEIQLRTAAQDAWSVISHKVLYKPAVALPPEMQRAAYRLVALVELFDTEVQRIMDSMASMPGSGVMDLVQLAELQFLPLAHSPSNMQLSTLILEAIQSSIRPNERMRYEEILTGFVTENESLLKHIYAEYGAHSVNGLVPDYVLFGQAESLIILERLNSKKHALVARWRKSDLPFSYLESLASAVGIDISDI
jgi:ppGpp synthetase/RelA/SpoT-type nucleotidyltranferase